MSQVQAIPQSESKGELKNASRSVPIIKKINEMIAAKKPFYSFEYFPPKTAEGVQNLSTRLERMAALQPMFMDVTWGAGGTTAELTMEISSNAQQFLSPSPHVMPHLTCTNMPTEKIKEALEKAKAAGIRNILALRGDPPKGMETWEQCEGGFGHAVDLVKHIRQEHKDYFGVAVAGYPEGHVSAKSIDEDIKYLKQKVDAGADFIVTQLFYDVGLYVEWVKKCRAAGITVPIIPGIMPIQDYNGFKRMTGFCKTFVPKEINDALEPIKNDDARVKAYGIELGTQMCKQLLAAGAPGLHFYTLNLEKSVTSILENLGFISSRKDGAMPWKQAAISKRDKEEVRPIFWANRPQSYLDRTTGWDEFPNGRWGDVASPAFGDLSDYHLCSFRTGKKEERAKIWGASPKKEQDVYDVFCGFIDGDVPRLPWCENVLQLETIPIKEALKKMNKGGFLTINSQPRVNGEKSTNASVGWGGPGGYVYQKAYLEFFVSPANLERMIKAIGDAPSLAYTAIDAKGNVKSNCIVDGKRQVTAVTWGVFPNKEIVQPTVVDTYSFQIWKDEAFALWQSQWESIYEEGSDSRKLLKTIRDTYFLVNVVDNDYVNGDIFAFFVKLLS